jgi:hypothetical protein
VAGYSGRPLAVKLGLREGARAALVAAPPGFEAALAPLPEGARLVEPVAPLDLALLFTRREAELSARFPALAAALTPAGALWVAWPKKAAKIETDLTEDVVRAVGLSGGLVDNKVCAIDEVWSGLRFVRRLADRPRKA